MLDEEFVKAIVLSVSLNEEAEAVERIKFV